MLIGLVVFGLLLAILIKVSSSSGEIEKLKRGMDSLNQRVAALEKKKPDGSDRDGISKVQPGPATAKPFPAVVAETQPAREGSSEPKVTPPPLKAVAKAQPPPLHGRSAIPTPSPSKPAKKRKDLFELFRGIGLWPPSRAEGSSELVLMQWWTPRIGGGLAILSIIFFAVYVAQGTPPWIKFLEMLVASFGVFGLGWYLSKKRPAIGNVLTATGLSMIYISSVAGYAVGPVKVVDNPILGALMQVAALVLNFGLGSWKKERAILVLALIFGYVSSLFAALEGFREAALISSLLVYLAGLFSYRRIGGLTLISLSLAGVYLPLGGFIAIELIKDAPVFPHFWSVIGFLILTVSVLPGCKLLMREPGFLAVAWNRLYQSLNTSLAIGSGFFFVAHFYPLGKTEFYGVLAVLFVLWSLVWFARDSRGIEFHLFFLKGSVLASLWFINYYHGDLRWMALGVQVVVLAASVHRCKSVWLEGIALLTWLVSFRYFSETDLNQLTGSFLWAIQGAYMVVSVAGLGYLMAYRASRKAARRLLYSLPAVLLAGVAIKFAGESNIQGIDPPAIIALMSLAILLLALVPVVNSWLPIAAGGLVFLAGHLAFWLEPSGVSTLAVVLGITAVCLVGFRKTKVSNRNIVETAVHAVWVITVLYFLRAYEFRSLYPVLIAAFSVLLFLGGYSPLKRLPEVCALPLLFLLVFVPPGEYPAAVLFIFAILVGLLANVGVVFPRYRQFVLYSKSGDLLWWLLNALFLFWTNWVLVITLGLTNQLLLWVGLGAIFFVIWYVRALAISFVAALFCAAVPVVRIVDLWLNPPRGGFLEGAPWAGQVLLAGLMTMTLWLVFGGYTKFKSHARLSEKNQELLAWVSGLTAYLVYAAALDYPLLNWERLYTPLLGAFSIGLIVLGIVLKSRAYRFVAMLTFLVPLFRLFAYDIRETLFRIIAFAVLAVVLTVVGFLYQKFSSRIE